MDLGMDAGAAAGASGASADTFARALASLGLEQHRHSAERQAWARSRGELTARVITAEAKLEVRVRRVFLLV